MSEAESLITVLVITLASSFGVMVFGANLGRLLNVASSFYNKARQVVLNDTGRR